VPTFIAEISDDHVRGIYGSLVVLFCNGGMFFAYVCGGFFDYHTNPWMMLPFPVAFILIFVKFPDSPISLMKRKRFDVSQLSFSFIFIIFTCNVLHAGSRGVNNLLQVNEELLKRS
jgi:MFS family permease